jgi:hypothetical protein
MGEAIGKKKLGKRAIGFFYCILPSNSLDPLRKSPLIFSFGEDSKMRPLKN